MFRSGRWTATWTDTICKSHKQQYHQQLCGSRVTQSGRLRYLLERLPPLALCIPMKSADPTGDVAGLGYPPELPPSHSRIRTDINDLSLNCRWFNPLSQPDTVFFQSAFTTSQTRALVCISYPYPQRSHPWLPHLSYAQKPSTNARRQCPS